MIIIGGDKETQARLTTLIGQVKRPRQVMAPVGREVRNQLVKHFRGKDRTEPNKLGGARTHFWLEISRSVNQPVLEANDTAVRVSISDPRLPQKVFGGPIRAKRGRNLSIPEVPEAHGRTPATYERETGFKLFFLQQNDHALLARTVEGHGIEVVYLLTPSVTQPPDPTALPDQKALETAVITRAESVVTRLTAEANAAAPSGI